MKKQILTILAGFMLATSGLHGMAGYTFHFDAHKTQPMPLDEHISSILPDNIRASKEYRDELYKMKRNRNIQAFLVVRKKTLSENVVGTAYNIGITPLQYALITLDEDKMAKEAYEEKSYENTHTLAHELGHVKKNHRGKHNILVYASHDYYPTLPLFLGIATRAYQNFIQKNQNILGNDFIIKEGKKISRNYLFTAALIGYYAIALYNLEEISDAIREKQEYEAEVECFDTLAECGYQNAIKAHKQRTEWKAKRFTFIKAIKILLASVDKRYYNLAPLEAYVENIEEITQKDPEQFEREALALLQPISFSIFNPYTWFIPNTAQDQIATIKTYIAFVKENLVRLHTLRRRGGIYPSIPQEIKYISEALCKCRLDVDPNQTVDTPLLMRNGPKRSDIVLRSQLYENTPRST